jgi:hypothetical protein
MIKHIKQPVYYWSSYWQKWDEIIGWNIEKDYIVVKEVGTEKNREHCTLLIKNNLSTAIVNRAEYGYPPLRPYKEFEERLKIESGKAWSILRDSGIPRWILNFE